MLALLRLLTAGGGVILWGLVLLFVLVRCGVVKPDNRTPEPTPHIDLEKMAAESRSCTMLTPDQRREFGIPPLRPEQITDICRQEWGMD